MRDTNARKAVFSKVSRRVTHSQRTPGSGTPGRPLLPIGWSPQSHTGRELGQGQDWDLERRPGLLLLSWPGITHLLADDGGLPHPHRPMPLGQGVSLTFLPKLQRCHCPASCLCLSTLRAEAQPTLCISVWGNLSWTQPSPEQLLGPGPPAPAPHLLPVQPGAQAGLAHCLWHGLLTAVPCLSGHKHAELALRVLWQPFSEGGDPRAGAREKRRRVPVSLAQCRWTQEGEGRAGLWLAGEGVGAGDGQGLGQQAHLGQRCPRWSTGGRGRRPAGAACGLAACPGG